VPRVASEVWFASRRAWRDVVRDVLWDWRSRRRSSRVWCLGWRVLRRAWGEKGASFGGVEKAVRGIGGGKGRGGEVGREEVEEEVSSK
jgi:hypothetical protein